MPIHGLAVVEYVGEPFEIDGSLKHKDSNGIPIHYLTMNDLHGLVEAVGSLPDLIHYLESRHQLDSDLRSWIGIENHLFACNIMDDGFVAGLTADAVLARSQSMSLAQRIGLQRTRSHDSFVRPINYAIENLHERDPDLEKFTPEYLQGMIEPAGHRKGYLKIAAQLNRLPHRVRQEVGGRIVELEALANSSGSLAPAYFYIFAEDGTPIVFIVSADADKNKRAGILWPILQVILVKFGVTSGMVVMYPTQDLHLGLLFLYAEEVDLSGLMDDPDVKDLLNTVPEPKFLPVPKTPPMSADKRFELLKKPVRFEGAE